MAVMLLLLLFAAACGGQAVGSIGVALARNHVTGGVRVVEAPPGTGQRAGLAAGDQILAVDGKDVHTFTSDDELRSALRGPVGTRVKLRVERDGETREIEVERGGPVESPR
jgi:C-terminal processing protease CtpA/Prc